ncbi:MAG: glycosyltransferase family 39 protein [Chloroflexi bacterium]|nr:glycosyltransferase family 39 protein [Chloroflexota bacterium]MCY4246145.1 glycosyltransferase family 39 protein [Chloroflexota bacterium]
MTVSARWMPVLLLLTLLLAAPGLNGDLIWFDELTSISHAGGVNGPFSPLEIAESVQRHSPKHTPLFFEILALWGALAGWHQVVLRALPLFCGLLALAWIYRLGADFIDARAGLYACLLLALNAFWLDYFHEIRMYTLQFMLLAALAWHYLTITRAAAARRLHWAGLIGCAALSLYAQPFSIFFLLALGLWHLRWLRHPQRFWGVGLAVLVAALFYLPWLPVTLHGLTTKFDTAADAMPLPQALSVFLRLLGNGQALLLLIPFAGLVIAMRASYMRRLLPFLFLAGASLLALLAANEWVGLIPLRRSRYFFLTWGMLALALGGGLAGIQWRWLATLFFVVYAAAGLSFRNADDYLSHQGTVWAARLYPPLETIARALRGNTRAQDFVVGFTDANFVNRASKQGKSTADYYFETLLGIDGTLIPSDWDGDQLAAQLGERLANNPYLLLLHDPQAPPASLVATRDGIDRLYKPCDIALDQPRLFVQRYVDRRLSCQRAYQPIQYDNGIRIVDKFGGYDEAAQTVRLVTGWEVANLAQLRQYNVSLQILSADQHNVAQIDRHLYDNILTWHAAELPTAHLPPGDYRAVVIVYDRNSKSKLTGVDLTSGETGPILPIAPFTIER